MIFILNGKLWEFLRTLFDLRNAPHSFQRAIIQIFGKLNHITCYLNDLLIYPTSYSDAKAHLRKVSR